LDNAASMARGTLIHAWFEQIRWLDDGRPDPATLRHIAEKIELGGLHIDDALSSFHAMLQSPATAAALSRRSYPTPNGTPLDLRVHNERRFAVQHSGRLLSGTIDRLVLIYQNNKLVGADVIDFKTDAVSSDDPAGLEATVEHYRPQLEAYRHAVATMYQLPPTKITTRLLLLGPDIVKTVSSNTTQTNS
jgi:ATP-dependent exoDNAse (exonuclease V) beta subunit